MNLFNKKAIFGAGLSLAIFSAIGMTGNSHAGAPVPGAAAISGQGASEVYHKECGACHLAYPPRFLPKRSWEKIMATLDAHFGDNATLDEAIRSEVLAYAVGNSAENSPAKVSRKVLASLGEGDTPIRISDTPYFKRKHDEVRAEVFTRKAVGSPSNCPACHLTAEKGDFDEHKVKIPKK